MKVAVCTARVQGHSNLPTLLAFDQQHYYTGWSWDNGTAENTISPPFIWPASLLLRNSISMSLPWPLGTGQPREKHNYQPAKLWLRVESCVVRGCTKKVLTMWGHSSLSTLLLLSIAIHQYKIKLFNWKRTRSEIYIDTVKTENIDIFTWSVLQNQ